MWIYPVLMLVAVVVVRRLAAQPEVLITDIAPEATNLTVTIQGPIRASNLVHNPPAYHDPEAVRAGELARYRVESTGVRLPLVARDLTNPAPASLMAARPFDPTVPTLMMRDPDGTIRVATTNDMATWHEWLRTNLGPATLQIAAALATNRPATNVRVPLVAMATTNPPPVSSIARTLQPHPHVQAALSTNQAMTLTLYTTNALAPKFEPMGCAYCEKTHHWRVVEQWEEVTHTVLPVRASGRVQYIETELPKTNLHGLYTSNYVEHPAVWQKPSMAPLPNPPLPPEPTQLYHAARARNAVLTAARTNAVERREAKENRTKVIPTTPSPP